MWVLRSANNFQILIQCQFTIGPYKLQSNFENPLNIVSLSSSKSDIANPVITNLISLCFQHFIAEQGHCQSSYFIIEPKIYSWLRVKHFQANFSTNPLLILLILAFFLRKISIFCKNSTFTQSNSVRVRFFSSVFSFCRIKRYSL